MTGEVDIDIDDPRWFPVDLDVPRRNVHFARIDEGTVERSAFIDSRLDLGDRPVTVMPVQALAGRASQQPPAWLWHTSFCGSTLLARMLHMSPYSVSLREPLVLRRMSDSADAGASIAEFLGPTVALLARPWHPGGHSVIKPTHAALNIAKALMDAAPASKAIVLTSSLDDFLVSHLKKTPQTLERIPLLAERALRAGRFASRLARDAFQPPAQLAAAALQWAAQRELVAELRDHADGRVKVIEWEEAQADLFAAAQGCSEWLQLALPTAELERHVATLARQHAKAPGEGYDVARRREEIAWLRGQYAGALGQARSWAEAHVLPHMRPDAIAI